MSDEVVCRILEGIGELRTDLVANTVETKNIVARLDKQNGTVTRHEEMLGKILVRLAEREKSCTLLVPLQAYVAKEEGKALANSTWFNRLQPVIYALIGIIGTLILIHSRQLLGI